MMWSPQLLKLLHIMTILEELDVGALILIPIVSSRFGQNHGLYSITSHIIVTRFSVASGSVLHILAQTDPHLLHPYHC